jgi:hypothetical protein
MNKKNLTQLKNALDEIQFKSTTRLLTCEDVKKIALKELDKILDLGATKKSLVDSQIIITAYQSKLPSSYGYGAKSTFVELKFNGKNFDFLGAWRDYYRASKTSKWELSDESKDLILERLEDWRK